MIDPAVKVRELSNVEEKLARARRETTRQERGETEGKLRAKRVLYSNRNTCSRGDRGEGGIHGWLGGQDLEVPRIMVFDNGLEGYIGVRDRSSKKGSISYLILRTNAPIFLYF